MGFPFVWPDVILLKRRNANVRLQTPRVLVTTDWVAQNLNTAGLRLVKVDLDTTAYNKGHIPGAVGWNWQTLLQDSVRRDVSPGKAVA